MTLLLSLSLIVFVIFALIAFGLGRLLNGVFGLLLDFLVVGVIVAGIVPVILTAPIINVWPLVIWYLGILGAYLLGNVKLGLNQSSRNLWILWAVWTSVITIALSCCFFLSSPKAEGDAAPAADPYAQYYR